MGAAPPVVRLPPGGEEAAWTRAAQAGDREAFGRLVERHQEAVMTTARYLTGNREDAADVAQETFLRAYRSLPGFAGQSAFRTWIMTITVNAARSHLSRRRARKRSAHEVRIDQARGQARRGQARGDQAGGEEAIDIPDPDARGRPDGLAMRVELKEALEEAIAGLDEESRAAVVMRDLAGESYQAVAAALGLPLGTVKSRIHRARLELRERLRKLL